MYVCVFACTATPSRSDKFVIGLTDADPNTSPPTLWNYVVCGQYPGNVPAGATVSLQCARDLPASQFVIVQFPGTDLLNFVELQVFALGD